MLAALLWPLVAALVALRGSPSAAASPLAGPSPSPFPQLRGPAFVYRCDEARGACVKTPVAADNGCGNRTGFAWSQRACQARCGPAGSLWPLPTGAVRLGAGLVPVAAAGELVLPPDCASAASPRLVSLLRLAHRSLRQRLQAEEVASRAHFSRGLRLQRAAPAPRRRPRQADAACGAAPSARLDVEVCVESDVLSLDWTTDESYVLEGLEGLECLEAGPGGRVVRARIRAATFFGARHALETLSQLVAHTGPPPDGGSDGHLVVVDSFSVTDAPAFPHRGLLLDTSRNYFPPAYIQATISAMAQNKLNVLHWHITDSQSFPYEATSLPQMAAYGAYSPRHTYPARTVRKLRQFALSRGVRLLPELDAPAHVAAGWQWGPAAGLGELVVCAGKQPWNRYCVEPPCGQLNPANPNVYRVLTALIEDMFRDFYDAPYGDVPYFHMGGDEVHLGCWNSSREVLDFMARSMGRHKRRKEDFVALWGQFQAKATQSMDSALRSARRRLQDDGGAAPPEGPRPGAELDDDAVREAQANSVLRRRQAPDDAANDAASADDAPTDDALDASPLSAARPNAVPVAEPRDDDDALRGARAAAPVAADAGQDAGQDADNALRKVPVILWTSELTAAKVIQKYLDRDRYVIQLWLQAGDPLARDLVSKGYRVIVSTKNAWYLDHGFGNWKGNATTGYGYHPWQDAYNNDPLAGLDGLDTRQVLGGEAAIWSEQADPSGASTKTWPRAAAVAERLWSGARATSWTSARIRFVRHRERMARLGTPSEAVQPEWCTQHEGQCY